MFDIAAFWGIRVALQGVFDVKEHLTAVAEGRVFSADVLFVCLTAIYAWAALSGTTVSGAEPRHLSVTVLGPAGDSRLSAVDEAIEFWNEQLTIAHANVRVGPVTRSDLLVSDEVLRAISDPVLAGGRGPSWPPQIEKAAGDVVIALSGADLISVGISPARGRTGLAIIRRPDILPLSLPNVARNVIAHELGHVLGLPHNSDPARLMCGRPASCRPAVFQSDTKRFFPLTDAERGVLARRFR